MTDRVSNMATSLKPVVDQIDILFTGLQLSYVHSYDDREVSFDTFKVDRSGVVAKVHDLLQTHPDAEFRLAIVDAPFTLIPDELYHPGDAISFFRNNVAGSDDYIVQTDAVSNHGLQLIYGIKPDDYIDWPQLERISCYHYLTPLMNFTPSATDGLNVFRLEGYTVLIGIKNRQISLVRILPEQTVDDVFFQILNCYAVTELDKEKDPLILSGRLDLTSSFYRLLYDHIRHIDIAVLPGLEADDTFLYRDLYLMSKHLV